MAKNFKLVHFVAKNKKVLSLLGIYILGIITFSILIVCVVRVPGTDDFTFQRQISPFGSLLEWLDHRYHTWSGRIFAESFVYIFSPLPLYWWKLVEVILYALFSGFLFLYYLLFTKKRSDFKDYSMLLLSLILPALIDTGVLLTSVFWVTGSMNYFWLATFGLIAFYPVAFYTIRKRVPNVWITVSGILAMIVAASSQEQGGLILTVMTLLFTVYTVYLNFFSKMGSKIIPYYLIIFLLIAIICMGIGLGAPGNAARVGSETITWRPDFYTIPLIDHVEYAGRWFIDSVINHSGFLLITVWALIAGLFIKKITKTRLDYLFIGILSAASILALAKGFDSVNPLLTFYPSWQPDIPHYKLSLLVLIPWVITIIATILSPMFLYGKRNIKGYLVAILLSAFLCSAVIITLSPTMYASGPRTLFFPAAMLIVTSYVLFDEFIDKHKKETVLLFILLILCLAIAQFYKLATHLLSIT